MVTSNGHKQWSLLVVLSHSVLRKEQNTTNNKQTNQIRRRPSKVVEINLLDFKIKEMK